MKAIPLPSTSHTPAKYAGPSLEAVLAQRKQFLNPGLFLYYKQPIMIVEGKMQWVWDSTGKRYLDGLGGIVTVSVGHCHPHVLKAMNEQNQVLQLQYGLALEIFFWALATFTFFTGLVKYIQQKKRIVQHRKNIGNYQLEWETDDLI